MASTEVDVLIRGAGPVGCALALALRPGGKRVSLLSSEAHPSSFRPIALSYASRLILERLGVWDAVPRTAIETIRVSQAGAFGRARLDAADAGVPALGYVTEYAALVDALRRPVQDLLVSEPVPARCEVHAEGWSGDARETRYAQDALVARIETRPPSSSIAYERFTPEGPLALLPHAGAYALIWTATPENCRQLAESSEEVFLERLAELAEPSIGTPTAVGRRGVVPLAMRVRAAKVGERAVYIGNAAQTLHPVAGQGLNVGLRDAWDLALMLRDSADPGDATLLQAYAARRRIDAGAALRSTDLLARMFLGSGRLARGARGIALSALDIFPQPRRFFTRRMIFGASAFP